MPVKNEEAFKLKSNFLPITVIKFFRCDQRSVLQQLKEIHKAAPNYFRQSPVIMDVTYLKRPSKGLDLAKLSQLLREYQLIPVGIQGLSAAEETMAAGLGLALWRSSTQTEAPQNTQTETTPLTTPLPPKSAPMIVTKPVRSGMRIYAKQSNLVLLAPVSSGAECIADGDIFCYAPVRGRILAGAAGDVQAQIFSHSLEAELIAIAGYYLLYDECPSERAGHFQIVVKESKLHINNFSLERSVSLCQK